MDQQLERNEHQKLREMLTVILKTQEAILHRLTLLEEKLGRNKE